jgi:undecaprenyl-diphosphatase
MKFTFSSCEAKLPKLSLFCGTSGAGEIPQLNILFRDYFSALKTRWVFFSYFLLYNVKLVLGGNEKMKKYNVLLSVCLMIFILFVFYNTRIIRAFDDAARKIILSFRDEALNELFIAFTYIGDATILGVLCIFSVTGLFLFRSWLSGILLLASIGISYGLNLVLKNAFERERPLGNRLLEEDGFSFPSGNAMVGTSFYLFSAFLLYQRYQKPWILWIGTILPFFLGLSRVYVGVHYPSDILAGFSFGLAFCVCLAVIYKKLNANSEEIKNNKNTYL